MPLFRIQIHGQNFWLLVEGKLQRVGFYTPRLVDAADEGDAERAAIEEFRQSSKFQGLIESAQNAEGDAPTLVAEGTEEVVGVEGVGGPPPGLAFYIEANDD